MRLCLGNSRVHNVVLPFFVALDFHRSKNQLHTEQGGPNKNTSSVVALRRVCTVVIPSAHFERLNSNQSKHLNFSNVTEEVKILPKRRKKFFFFKNGRSRGKVTWIIK